MSNNIQPSIQDPDYKVWVRDLSQRYMQSQVRAAVGINSEQLRFYWSVGRDIISMHVEERWGQGVIRQLSQDLTSRLDRKGFSVTSLGYMKRFYQLYPDTTLNLPPAEGRIPAESEISPTKASTPSEYNLPPAEGKTGAPIFLLPWSHHKAILDKVGSNQAKALFYVHQCIHNQWGRAMLENMLQTDLYEVQGQSANNFDLTLPTPEADLARDLFKGTYQFGFTQISQPYNEAIGLLICRSKNTIFAQYALDRINAPIGIADYRLYPQLPTPEEIQKELQE